MSDLDNAINSINASAAKAENTATFLDDMSTFDDQSSVINPNNGQTVASIPKQVKDRTDELFAAAESDINQAVADAEQSATDAQDAADSVGSYQGLWPDMGGSANKGDTYQTQVSGAPTGQYFTALQNTTVDPVGDDVNWREVVGVDWGGVSAGTEVKHRRGTNAEILAGTPAIGELWFNTTDNSIHMGDGVTQGGIKQSPVFNSVADMKDNYLVPGMVVETKSYYNNSADDTKGSAKYKIVTAAEYGGTPDGYGDHTLTNGNVAKLIITSSRVDATQWGMTFDGVTNDTAAFTNLLTLAQDKWVIKLHAGETVISSVWIRAGVTVEGASRRGTNGTVIKAINGSNTYCIGVTQPNCNLRRVSIDGSGSSGYGVLWSGVKTKVMEEVIVTGFTDNNPGFLDGIGVVCEATYSNKMINCEITGNRTNILFRNNGELNVFTMDNCTIEYSSDEAVVIDKGWNVNFESCSFGHHGVDPDWTGTAIKVTDPDAQVCVNNTWFEWGSVAIEFAGKNLSWTNNHTVGRVEVSAGTATVNENQFFGFGSYMTVPTGTSGKIVQWNNIHSQSQGDMIQDPDGKVFEAVSEVVKYVTATLTPETSGTISLLASEDILAETVQGSIVNVQGRLTLSSASSPVGSYIELGGLTYQPPSYLPEKAEFASGSCVFYDASGAVRTIEGIDAQQNENPRIWIPASSVGTNDTLTINFSYKFK